MRGFALNAVKNLVDNKRFGHTLTVSKPLRHVNLGWEIPK
jgi:hypothetical protein